MTNRGTALTYPFDAAFQAQQPLVLMDGSVFAMTGLHYSDVVLQTAARVRHSLTQIGTLANIWQTYCRRSRHEVEQFVLDALPGAVSNKRMDALAYFVTYLAPGFQRRDCDEDQGDFRPSGVVAKIDWGEEVRRGAASIPMPDVRQPALWMLGRSWNLAETKRTQPCWEIQCAGRVFTLTGDYSRIGQLTGSWRTAIVNHIDAIALKLAVAVGELDGVAEVRGVWQKDGFIRSGDLLLIHGSPPTLAHVIPPHFNRTLSRQINGDLAVGAQFSFPLTNRSTGLFLLQKNGSGW
ncbi:MAG: hypothetical protein KDA96_12330, partial [Planctomycetaceae bacterium]|nr:hypothetical protein [Planctomycetaceae bacterium]